MALTAKLMETIFLQNYFFKATYRYHFPLDVSKDHLIVHIDWSENTVIVVISQTWSASSSWITKLKMNLQKSLALMEDCRSRC